LRRDPNIVVEVLDRFGVYPWVRPNHIAGPTANVAVRRAIMAALDGREIIAAAVGDEPGMVTVPIGMFTPESPYACGAGMDRLGPKPLSEITAMLKEAGYANERLVLLHQSDILTAHAMLQVMAKRLTEAGFNVDDEVMDLATVVSRRNSREAPDKGGWSLIFGTATCTDLVNPLLNLGIRTGAAAWIGWPADLTMEELRDRWLDSADAAEQKQLAARIQETALADVLLIPLGRYLQYSAWRSNLSGVLRMNFPVMWNISKS
jgi:peptide/nickel transport system substrate-binding protein